MVRRPRARMRFARRAPHAAARAAPMRQRVVSAIVNAEIVVALALVALCHGGALFGLEAMSVKSGSMEPAVKVGSLAYVRAAPDAGASARPGDVIAFRSGTDGEATVLHRVESVDARNEALSTKGDANDAPDPFDVPFDAVVGTLEGSIPCLGALLEGFSERKAAVLATVAGANAALVAAATLPSRRQHTNDWRKPCTQHRRHANAGWPRRRRRRWRSRSAASPPSREQAARSPTSRMWTAP